MKKIISIVLMLIMMVLPLASCASTPSISISEDGYWVINGVKTDTKAQGDKGDTGAQGVQGEKGDKGDQGIQGIQGEKGDKGDTGEKGDKGDTGAQGAQGEKGDDGDTPTIEISDDGYWVINGVKTNVKAQGEDGEDAAASNENPQGLAFYLKNDGTYAVGLGTAKYLSKIIIPSTYRGKPVTEIAEFGFVVNYHDGEKSYLTEIVIPDSVKIIGENAFDYCDSLSSVTIPESVTKIGDDAFGGCEKLVEVYNLSSLDVSSVFDDALVIHTSLEEESILEKKGNFVLLDWEGERHLVTYIGNDTETVVIPDGVTIIDGFAFYNCESLTSITIPDTVTSIDNCAFFGCSSLKSITIPDSVTSIGGSAFEDCTSLTSITIPDSVTNIGDYAFFDCYNLIDVYYTGTEDEWNTLVSGLGDSNSCLTGATIHFNHVIS